MSEIVIFSGTQEGRTLSAYLEGTRVRHSVCVASDYGEVAMEPSSYTRIHTGRMEQKEMEEYLRKVTCSTVVDATHPFALNASEVIKAAADHLGIPYLRMLNDASDAAEYGDMTYFKDAKECAKALTQTDGNILVTSGGKDLDVFCQDESVKERIYARVLPSAESFAMCEENGVTGKHILGLLGPFSEEMNYAMLKQYDIKVMVTQESGVIEGFSEKIAAAKRAGVKTFVVGSSEEKKGLSFNEVLDALEDTLMVKLEHETLLSVSLCGVGIGDKKLRTVAVEKKIKHADMIFGPERLVEELPGNTYPFTQPKDIFPIIELELKNTNKLHVRAVVLFDGDISLSSDANDFAIAMDTWKSKQKCKVELFKLPGISSVSYFAAQIQRPYENLSVISVCNASEDTWKEDLALKLKRLTKLYLLVDGVAQLQEVALLMEAQALVDLKLMMGYQLSREDEKIFSVSVRELAKVEEEGNYILYIENDSVEKRKISYGFSNEEFENNEIALEEFVDGSVENTELSITNEEIRQIVISKLKLSEQDVLLDIGAGTGSVAVSVAAMSDLVNVYAIEKDEVALAGLEANKEKFALGNLTIVKGSAPDVIRSLPDADAAFVGYNDGELLEVLRALRANNPKMRVAVLAETLEDILGLHAIAKEFTVSGERMVQIGVAEILAKDERHIVENSSPVVLYTFQFGDL